MQYQASGDSSAAVAAVVVRGLSKRLGATTALDAVDLLVQPGQVVGLLGPSGAGKSTLIRCLVGLLAADAGSMEVLGLPAGSPTLRSLVGYMAQASALYPDLSARENLAFFADLYSAPSQRVADVLTLVELEDVADRPVATLSGGQRQRVSLGVALVPNPRLLLLDEPTVGLDPRLRLDLWAAFARWAHQGVTLVVTSHVMDEADRCDTVALMRDGRVVAQGTPARLRELSDAPDLEAAFLELTRDG